MGSSPATRASAFRALPVERQELEYVRMHEIGPHLDACAVVRAEANRTVGPAETDAWDPARLGGVIEPGARDAEKVDHLGRPEELSNRVVHVVLTLQAVGGPDRATNL